MMMVVMVMMGRWREKSKMSMRLAVLLMELNWS